MYYQHIVLTQRLIIILMPMEPMAPLLTLALTQQVLGLNVSVVVILVQDLSQVVGLVVEMTPFYRLAQPLVQCILLEIIALKQNKVVGMCGVVKLGPPVNLNVVAPQSHHPSTRNTI